LYNIGIVIIKAWRFVGMEFIKCEINRELAEKLGQLFGVLVERFILT